MILNFFFFFLNYITKFTIFRYIHWGEKISIHVATIHSLSNQKSRPFSSSSLCAKFKFLPLPSNSPFIDWKQKNSNLWNRKPKRFFQKWKKKILRNHFVFKTNFTPRPPPPRSPYFSMCANGCKENISANKNLYLQLTSLPFFRRE